MTSLFHSLLVSPLLKLLVFLYTYVAFGDFGIAIILLTILVRLVLYPFFYKSMHQQAIMRKVQPEIERIQKQHTDNREEQGRALLALYREHNVNPLTGFFLILIQLPVLIALYQVFINPPPGLNHTFLSLINLQEQSTVMVGIAVLAQYFFGRMMVPPSTGSDTASVTAITRTMIFMGPLITMVVLYNLPAAVGLYWVATTLFSLGQQWYINKQINFHGTSTGPNSKITGISRHTRAGG